MSEQTFYVHANFPLPDGGKEWRLLFNIPFEEAHAYEAVYYGKRDNSELEYKLINSITNEVISEADVIESYLISVASQE